MKKSIILGLILTSLAVLGQAADLPYPGQKLTKKQIAAWGNLPAYQIGKSQFRVLPVKPESTEATLVINAQGVVGLSRNEVTISGLPAGQVKAGLGQITPQPLSMQYFEQADVTFARYADFGQAVAGFHAIQAALPDATLRLPIQFNRVPY